MRRQYQRINFGPARLALIRTANEIITDYERQGITLTLRQIYYQFVAHHGLPNNIRSYKRLGAALDDGRKAGLIDWFAIEDRTRALRGVSTVAGPRTYMKRVPHGFRIDKWKTQPVRPEVWIEKDALVGIVGQACNLWQVDYFSCRGYTSSSEMHSAAQRIGERLRSGQSVTLYHLGDHDPSGIDMSRDIEDRLRMFIDKDNSLAAVGATDLTHTIAAAGVRTGAELAEKHPTTYERILNDIRAKLDTYGTFRFERIALTMDQVDELQPPPNPAKITDSRFRGYMEIYGHESWELDALPPRYLIDLITDSITSSLDRELWDEAVAKEQRERKMLSEIAEHWDIARKAINEHKRQRRELADAERAGGERGSAGAERRGAEQEGGDPGPGSAGPDEGPGDG